MVVAYPFCVCKESHAINLYCHLGFVMLTLKIFYTRSGGVREWFNLTSSEANRIITHISELQDSVGEVPLRIQVFEQ